MEHEQSSRLQRAVLQVIGVHLMRQPVETEASWRGIFGPKARTHSCPNDLLALPQEMDNILGNGAARLLPIVTETMREVKEKVGLAQR